ncbi:MAG TPA: adenosylcobinamide-GDP ribazoletransferase [Kineosporiaceae bacterium]|nr:adenosylcobinamide-GDP ribazoletransferase [Kineosporiaceae bacterium]
MRAGVLRDGALLAAGTLSVVRVPAPQRVDRAVAGVAMCLAPLIGFLVALPGTAVVELARRAGTGDLVSAALGVATVAWTTGGLHLDGVADTVDGLAAARADRAEALEVMRRGDVGPLGAAALVLTLIVQVAALARGLPVWGVWALPLAAVAGRCTLPVLCARGIQPARAAGLGAAVAGSVPRLPALLLPLAAAGLAGLLLSAGRADLAVAGGCAVGVALAALAVRRFAGITGDVLGAAVEWGTAAALVVLAAG